MGANVQQRMEIVMSRVELWRQRLDTLQGRSSVLYRDEKQNFVRGEKCRMFAVFAYRGKAAVEIYVI